jgi:hypothetical protein
MDRVCLTQRALKALAAATDHEDLEPLSMRAACDHRDLLQEPPSGYITSGMVQAFLGANTGKITFRLPTCAVLWDTALDNPRHDAVIEKA